MTTQIAIRTDAGTLFRLNDDMDGWGCDHLANGAYMEPPCCSEADREPDTGMVACGCGGQGQVVCPAPDCTGINPWEIEELMENLS
jgi:hypothetical protein